MNKDDAQIFVNAISSSFIDTEIEASIAEANGISREEYNKIIWDDLELPDCIKKYKELNRQKQYHEEKLIKHELKESEELLTKARLIRVFALYPQFQEDYNLLKEHNYFTETELGLKWNVQTKSKQALAEYFGNLPLPPKRKNRPWKEIELLFDTDGLKHNFSRNGNEFKGQSKEYSKILQILSRKNPTITKR